MLKFTIHIIPKAQMRTEPGVIKLANGKFRGTVHKKKKQRSHEETIKAFLVPHQPETPLSGALLLGLRVYLPAPQGKPAWFTGKPKDFRELVRQGKVRPISKPDMDNLVKQIKDCMTQCRFWKDDAQVVGYLPCTGKYYSDSPRWEIEIVQLHSELYRETGKR